MKLLVYLWNAYLEADVLEICQEKGVSVKTFSWTFRDKNQDDRFMNWFGKTIDIRTYDAVLSINYWPLLSQVCQDQGIRYIAWCYDNPLNVVKIEETLANPVNAVFLFDKIQYFKYKNTGFDTVYYLPLGVNASRMKRLSISDAEYARYAAQVSFVGQLYESRLPEIMAPMNEYTKGYLNALMNVQTIMYGAYLLDECITEELIRDINDQYLQKVPDTEVRLSKEALNFAMACEITRKNRIILLSLCGARYDTRLYSYQNSEVIKNVKKCSQVDYLKEMPLVFACSKINLNPSLRIIQTGIPLRAFDIMGAGGFLLSNYQEELLEYFENEKDMVVYESMEDAIAKINFYLNHEDLRRKIAESGRIKTLEEHSLQNRFEQIISDAGL
ncbi:MAG: glycosyltransferase [Lachnospiraceae bacterium]|nr:glycosyltransferase [Lachnospiraceae bacterium]